MKNTSLKRPTQEQKPLKLMASILKKQNNVIETLTTRMNLLAWRVDRLEAAAKKLSAEKKPQLRRTKKADVA